MTEIFFFWKTKIKSHLLLSQIPRNIYNTALLGSILSDCLLGAQHISFLQYFSLSDFRYPNLPDLSQDSSNVLTSRTSAPLWPISLLQKHTMLRVKIRCPVNLINVLDIRKGIGKFKSPVWRVYFKMYSPGSLFSHQWRLCDHFSGALVPRHLKSLFYTAHPSIYGPPCKLYEVLLDYVFLQKIYTFHCKILCLNYSDV